MIFRKGFDAVQIVAEEAVFSPFQRMRNGRPAFFLFRLGFFNALLVHFVAEQTGVVHPAGVIVREGRGGAGGVADHALIFVAFNQVRNARAISPVMSVSAGS